MTKYIDAGALKRKLDAWKITPSYVYRALDETLVEDVRPATRGTLIFDKESPNWSMNYPYKCSKCSVRLRGLVNFCPNCGCQINKEVEE